MKSRGEAGRGWRDKEQVKKYRGMQMGKHLSWKQNVIGSQPKHQPSNSECSSFYGSPHGGAISQPNWVVLKAAQVNRASIDPPKRKTRELGLDSPGSGLCQNLLPVSFHLSGKESGKGGAEGGVLHVYNDM